MTAKSQLVIELIAQNIAAVRSQMDGLTGSLRSFEKGTAGLVKGAAFGLGAGVVIDQVKNAVMAASDLAETQNKVNVVFGESAAAVNTFADNSAKALGQSRQQALEASAQFGTLFTTMGLSQSAAAGMSQQMVQLATDMASFNNIGTAEALEKLRSGLVGEAEPLRTVGVLLNEAAVKAEAYRSGIAKQGAELSEAEKVQARYSLIMQQTAAQQGDFADTADSMANRLRVMAAAVENTQANIGQGLLPAILAIAPGMQDAILGFEEATRIFPQTVARASALVQLAYLELELAVKSATINMQIATVSAFDAIGVKAVELVRNLAKAADAISKIPIPGIQQSAGFSNNVLNAFADGIESAGESADGLREALVRVQQETADRRQSIVDYANSIGQIETKARAAAPALGGPAPTGLAGSAKAAKTALEELGISASTIRSALDILGISAEEQANVLIALGVAAIDAGPLIEGLGITVDKLAEALNRAGLAGNELAQRVPGLIAAHKEQEKAAREAEEAERKLAEQMKAEAEEMGRYIAEALKGGKDATAGTSKYFEQMGLKKLEEEINGYARRIQDAMREGADPAPILAEAEAVFGRYRDEVKRLADGEEMEKLKQSIRDLGETWSYVDENAGTAGMKKALERAQQTARAAADEARDIASSEAANNVAKHMAALAKDNEVWKANHEAKQQALQDERNTLASQLQIQESINKAAERESAARAQMAAAQRRQSGIMALARGLVGLGRFDALGSAGDNPDATNPLLRQLQAATDILTVIANKTGQTMDSFTVGNLTGQTMSREASLLGAAGLAFMH